MKVKKIISILISALMIVSLTACTSETVSSVSETISSVEASVEPSVEPSVEASVEEPVAEPPEDPIMTVNDEGFVVFGNYEQDGNDSNGAEPIEWEVLGTDDTGVLLISRYILDCRQYDPNMTSVTWGSCDLRIWLNTDFLNTAFTLKEQQSILEASSANTANEYYSTDAGNDTKEKVFILSAKEIIEHYDFNIWVDERLFGISDKLIVPATEYAIANGVKTDTITEDYATKDDMHRFLNDNLFKSSQIEAYLKENVDKTAAQWWLRTPGNKQFVACTVTEYGRAGYFYGQNVTSKDVGVRPAIYIEKMP